MLINDSPGISGSVGNLPEEPGTPSEPSEPEEPEEPVLTLWDSDYSSDGKGIYWDNVLSSGNWSTENGAWTSEVGVAGLANGKITNDTTKGSVVYYLDAKSEVVSRDSYLNLGPEVALSNYGVVMYDIDITVDENFDWQLGLRPNFCDSERGNSAKTGGAIRYVDGHIRNIDGSMLMPYVGEKFHYTFIFFNEGDDCTNDDGSSKGCNNGRILVYVNGELLCVREPSTMFYDDIQYFCGFRVHIVPNVAPSEYASVSFSNLYVSVFSPEYDGAIYDLLENPDVNLSDNSDTLLYQ